MTEFRVGDRVRVKTTRYEAPYAEGEGVVTRAVSSPIGLEARVAGVELYYRFTEVELVKPYDIKPGDRFKITIEGTFGGDDGFNVGTYDADRDFDVTSSGDDVVTIEKIEPPVEKFKAGDTVRSKIVPDYTYLVLKEGYVDLTHNIHNHFPTVFTSKDYEKVNLAEVPF